MTDIPSNPSQGVTPANVIHIQGAVDGRINPPMLDDQGNPITPAQLPAWAPTGGRAA